MNAARLVFSPFSSFVSQNREYAHVSQWTFKSREYIHFALLCGNFVEKLNHRKKDKFSIYFISCDISIMS